MMKNLLLLTSLFIFNGLVAQTTIQPDLGFADNGLYIGNEDINSQRAVKTEITSEGKIYTAGWSYDSTTLLSVITLSKLLPDGTPDPNFGLDGIRKHTFNDEIHNYPRTATLTSDDKLLIVGRFGNEDAGIARFLENGDLDTTFGDNGYANLTEPNLNDKGISLFVDSNNFIYVLNELFIDGQDVAPRPQVIRLNSSGNLDTSFGAGGSYIHDAGIYPKVIIADDSGIYIGGSVYTINQDANAILFKISLTGLYDPTFGINGYVSIDFSSDGFDQLLDMDFDNDGNIVTTGNSEISPDVYHLNTAKIDPLGNYVTEYGQDGKQTIAFPDGSMGGYSVLILSDNSIILAGYCFYDSNFSTKYAICKLDENGLLDIQFGNNGIHSGTEAELNQSHLWDVSSVDSESIICCGILESESGDMSYLPVWKFNLGGPINISEIEKSQFNIFPNPISDQFQVQFDSKIPEPVKFSLLDLTGKKIFDMTEYLLAIKGDKFRFELPNGLATGNYILMINQGKESFKKQIIVIR